jgi:hypothetical protein
VSAALDVDTDTTLRHLLRDHIHHGYVGHHYDAATGYIVIDIDDIDALRQVAAELRLARYSTWVDRYWGYYAEIHVDLCLKLPFGPFPGRRAS